MPLAEPPNGFVEGALVPKGDGPVLGAVFVPNGDGPGTVLVAPNGDDPNGEGVSAAAPPNGVFVAVGGFENELGFIPNAEVLDATGAGGAAFDTAPKGEGPGGFVVVPNEDGAAVAPVPNGEGCTWAVAGTEVVIALLDPPKGIVDVPVVPNGDAEAGGFPNAFWFIPNELFVDMDVFIVPVGAPPKGVDVAAFVEVFIALGSVPKAPVPVDVGAGKDVVPVVPNGLGVVAGEAKELFCVSISDV